MKPSHPQKRLSFILIVVVLAWLVSACAPTRIGVSWGALSEVEVYGQKGVLIAYNQYVSVLDPASGVVVALRDAEGRERLDENGNRRTWAIDGHSFENAQFFARPALIEENDMQTLLFPAYTDRLLKVTLDTARIDDIKGVTIGGPLIADMAEDEGRFYVALKSGDVIALEKPLLIEDWRYNTENGIWAQPLLHEGVLYVVSIDHTLHAVDAETGETVWSEPVDLKGVAAATPLFYDGNLYVGSYSNTLYKIALSGNILGEYVAKNWLWSTPVEYEGVLYIADLSGYVHAIDPTSMTAIWSVKVAEKGIRPSPLVTEDVVIVASRDGRLYWLNRTDGALIFTREIEGRPEILSELMLVEANSEQGLIDDMVVVSTVNMSHLVVAYTLDNGRAAWVYAR